MRRTLVSLAGLLLLAAAASAAPCVPSTTSLCLSSGRFETSATWTDFQGNTGSGQAVALTADTGYFWFFSSSNVELIVKVLDARGVNGHFWVFYGALSNVQYTLTVRDTQTGDVQFYDNTAGQFGSVGDTKAFPPDALASLQAARPRGGAAPVGRVIDEARVAPALPLAASACAPGDTALCLNGGRFRIEAAWKDFQGNTGAGHAVGLSSDTGYFWFFTSSNVEAVVKVLDGRPVNGHFWLFYGALSNVQYTLTVTDTATGIVKTYNNPSGLFASVGDTQAFGTPTTFQLLDGAVVKGEIDDETALVDKVYAFFGDPSLPAAYVGTPPGQHEHGIVREVADRWSELSPATQQLLETYLAPPTETGSWFNGGPGRRALAPDSSQDWTTISTARAKVWYRAADPGAQTAANNLAAEIEKIWDAETGLMQQQPASDGGRGGDDKLDIYVLPGFRDPPDATEKNKALGMTVPFPPYTQPIASYILIRAAYASTVEGARDVLAHEFFHTIAFALAYKFRLNTYSWLNEATATWMEDYVYPTEIKNLEQGYAPSYFSEGAQGELERPADDGYSEYLFLFYLARAFSPAVNAQVWANVKTYRSEDALDLAVPGGIASQWPVFALDCWNTPNFDKFKQWDNLTSGLLPDLADPSVKAIGPNGSQTLSGRSVTPLAMSYAYWHTDLDAIKRVEIQNQKLEQDSPYAKVQAWIKFADGTSRVEDWTTKERVVFCRDKDGQKITDLLILYTNSNPDPIVGDILVWNAGKITWDSIGCGYHGNVHLKRHEEDGSFDETVDTEATLLHMSNADFGTTVIYAAAEYTVRYQGTQETGSCTDSIGPVEHTFSGSEVAASLITFDTSVDPPTYSAQAPFFLPATETDVCPEGTTQHQSAAVGLWWDIPGGFKVQPDGSLSGTYTDGPRTFTWKFTPDTGDDGSQ